MHEVVTMRDERETRRRLLRHPLHRCSICPNPANQNGCGLQNGLNQTHFPCDFNVIIVHSALVRLIVNNNNQITTYRPARLIIVPHGGSHRPAIYQEVTARWSTRRNSSGAGRSYRGRRRDYSFIGKKCIQARDIPFENSLQYNVTIVIKFVVFRPD